eukprot:TRINITY_DN73566_c0_g1_i1.p1 TRINITY_DN73566_c0_g1~~TRINITY_DN73566_c0_g1_i1.p1  ORF type:complete len:347 (-),score=90.69 TRINITY_DN73566_c0_g1_i1:118-1158(-)
MAEVAVDEVAGKRASGDSETSPEKKARLEQAPSAGTDEVQVAAELPSSEVATTKAEASPAKKADEPAAPETAGETVPEATAKAEASPAEKTDQPAAPEAAVETAAEAPAALQVDVAVPKTESEKADGDTCGTEKSSTGENGTTKPDAKEKPREIDPFMVFVRNLPRNVGEDQLELDFSDYGEIDKVSTDAWRGLAWIKYETTEGATEALKKDGDEYWGRTVGVSLAFKDLGALFEAYIRGIPTTNTDDAPIKKLFEPCGDIFSMRVIRGDDGKAKGIAYVKFTTEESLNKAVKLDGQNFEGSNLSVEVAYQPAKGGNKGKGKSKGKGDGGKGKGKKGKGKGKSNRW